MHSPQKVRNETLLVADTVKTLENNKKNRKPFSSFGFSINFPKSTILLRDFPEQEPLQKVL